MNEKEKLVLTQEGSYSAKEQLLLYIKQETKSLFLLRVDDLLQVAPIVIMEYPAIAHRYEESLGEGNNQVGRCSLRESNIQSQT